MGSGWCFSAGSAAWLRRPPPHLTLPPNEGSKKDDHLSSALPFLIKRRRIPQPGCFLSPAHVIYLQLMGSRVMIVLYQMTAAWLLTVLKTSLADTTVSNYRVCHRRGLLRHCLLLPRVTLLSR